MSDIAITVDSLGKAYHIGLKEEIPDSIMSAIGGWVKTPLKNFKRLSRLDTRRAANGDAEDVFWALKDVSFEVKRGEVVGIIGRNGAGKSTLLKILSRITEPTTGRATIRGRVSSLLEVGTGFHPELSGRDNVYMNGTILGMSKREIDRKFDEIVDFSGVEKFLDTPVKRYSSGMKVRLAFAVAAHLEPEILIIDEVLAVGDAEFQKKCLGKMQDVAHGGRTVLFVSHNMGAIASLCTSGIHIASGHIESIGSQDQVIQAYIAEVDRENAGGRYECHESMNGSKMAITHAVVRSAGRHSPQGYPIGAPLEFVVDCYAPKKTLVPALGIGIENMTGERIVTLHSSRDPGTKSPDPVLGHFRFLCTIDDLRLAPGEYRVKLGLENEHGIAQKLDPAFTFTVLTADIYGTGTAFGQGLVVCRQGWVIDEAKQENVVQCFSHTETT